MPVPKLYDSLLLVEGSDDYHVLLSLCNYYQVAQTFQIKDKNGVTNLINDLGVELKQAGLKKLGIVVDADADLDARWQSLNGILKLRYPNLPTRPAPLGPVIDAAGQPRVGVWLMPDNALPGMLEDFVALLVADQVNDPLWQLSERCLQEARQLAGRSIPVAKARIHTYLAWQSESGTPLGLAITRQYFDASLPQAQRLVGLTNCLASFSESLLVILMFTL